MALMWPCGSRATCVRSLLLPPPCVAEVRQSRERDSSLVHFWYTDRAALVKYQSSQVVTKRKTPVRVPPSAPARCSKSLKFKGRVAIQLGLFWYKSGTLPWHTSQSAQAST